MINIKDHQPSIQKLFSFFLLFLALIYMVIFIVLTIRSLSWPIIHDNALMIYIAKLIQAGIPPYSGIFDFNLPATYFVHWVLINLFDKGLDRAYRIVDILMLLIISGLVVYATPKTTQSRIVLFGISLVFGVQILFDGPALAFQRDTWIALGLALFYLRFTFDLQNIDPMNITGMRGKLFHIIPLFSLGFLTMVKPTTAMLGVILLLTAKTKRRMLIRVFSFLTPFLLVIIWLHVLGGFVGLIDIATNYTIPLYTKLTSTNFQPTSLIRELQKTKNIIAFIGTFVGLLYICKTEYLREILPPLACLFFGIWHVAVQNRGSGYHFYPLYLAIVISIIFLVGKLTASNLSNFYYQAFLVALLLGQLYPVARNNPGKFQEDWTILPSYQNALIYSSIIDEVSKPNEPIMIFDSGDGLSTAMLYTDHPLCGRFLYEIVFFHDTENQYMKSLRNEMLATIASGECRVIIVSEKSWGVLEYVRTPDRIKYISGLMPLLQAYYSSIESDRGLVYVLKEQ